MVNGIGNIALVYPSERVRYQSYGDHWVDAAVELLGEKNVMHYRSIDEVRQGHDLYMFIEALPHWFDERVCSFSPRVLYCWDTHLSYFCYLMSFINRFDHVYVANRFDAGRLNDYSPRKNVTYLPPGFNSKLHRPLGIEKKYDIGFIGQQDGLIRRYPESRTRYEALVAMQEVFEGRCFIGQKFYGEDYVKLLNECKMVLDYRTHFEVGARVYECIGMGLPVACQVFTESEMLQSLVVEAFKYTKISGSDPKISFKQLRDDIDRTIELNHNPSIRKELFTYTNRLETILRSTKVEKKTKVVNLPFVNQEVTPDEGIKNGIGIVIPTQFVTPTLLDTLVPSIFTSCRAMGRYCHLVLVCDEDISGENKKKIEDIIGDNCGEKLTTILDNGNFTKKVNIGLSLLVKDWKVQYFGILNDDIVLCKDSIENLIKALESYQSDIVGPVSNCDYKWKHDILFRDWRGVDLIPSREYKDFGLQWESNLFALSSRDVKGINLGFCATTSTDWVAFYCTFMRRDVLETYGLLDEHMEMVCSDEEYCSRLPKGRVGYITQSFVFHYGAVTRKQEEKKNSIKYHNTDACDNASRKLKSKKTSKIKNVIFYSGPSWEKWSSANLRKGGSGIGGSEACQIHLANALARAGYNVNMYYDWDGGGVDSDQYTSYSYEHFDTIIENVTQSTLKETVFIYSRQPHKMIEVATKMRDENPISILWNHDIMYADTQDLDLSRADAVVNVGSWHRYVWNWIRSDVTLQKYRVINNGINLSEVCIVPNMVKAALTSKNSPTKRLIWTSSWDRGLDVLCEILRRMPQADLDLYVYYGTYNLEQWIKRTNNMKLLDWLNRLKSNLESDKRIKVVGRVSEAELMEAFRDSDIWCYPTHFQETFCLSALMAQATNCKILTRPLAALADTVGHRGIMVTGDVFKEDTINRYCEELSKLLVSKEGCMTNETFEYVHAHRWESIAERWIYLFKELDLRRQNG